VEGGVVFLGIRGNLLALASTLVDFLQTVVGHADAEDVEDLAVDCLDELLLPYAKIMNLMLKLMKKINLESENLRIEELETRFIFIVLRVFNISLVKM
jgi:hypothetical protein